MANIIYAPIIGETIPGFVTDTENIVLKTIEHKEMIDIGDWQYRSQNIDIKNKNWRNIEITITPDSQRGKINNRPLLQVGYLEGLRYIETQNYNLPLSAEEYKNLNNKIPDEATNAYILVYYQNEQEQTVEPEYKISLLKPSQIKVPFQMSSAVSQVDINGFSLKVSDYNGNELEGSPLELKKDDWGNIKDISYLEFNQRAINFDPNQYYKFQLAYIGKGEEEEEKHNRKYSYVSIGKCVGEKEDFVVQIKDLNDGVQKFSFANKNTEKIYYKNISQIKIFPTSCKDCQIKIYSKYGPLYWDEKNQVWKRRIYPSPLLIKTLDFFDKNFSYNELQSSYRSSQDYLIFSSEFAEYILLSDNNIFNIFNYDGEFKRSAMEPLYSYRYEFRDEDSGELLQSTSEILWNVDKDKKFDEKYYLSDLDDFKLTVNLDEDKIYTLQLFCTTVNGYEIPSSVYEIVKEVEVPWEKDTQGGFTATQDARAKENGYVTVEAYIKKGGINNLIFERREDENGPYKTIQTFNIEQTGPFKIVWQDQVIKQGVSYTYSLRYRTDNGLTKRYESNNGKPYFVDFDHIFLSDSERQLKIKFDPKVSSFRDTLLEQKTDTIGSRYPFFFRNNQIKYKEIPISGLISYHMDNDEFFMKQEDLGLNKIQNRNSTAAAGSISATGSSEVSTPATTDLVDYNIAAERKFKLEVLDWLNNGKPKLFRSPTEGNYVIRLMNVSLSPNDTLGRAIHSFSATGYECMDNDPQTLVENGLLRFEETDIKSIPAANLGVLTLGLSQLGVDWTKEKEGTNNE